MIIDRWSGHCWDYYLQNREAESINPALNHLFGIIKNQYQLRPKVVEANNKFNKPTIKAIFTQRFIKVEPSAPNTPAQNRGAERSGGVIAEKIRAMRAGAKLPAVLWPEISKAAVYLHNRIPRYGYNWRTPYNRFHTYLAHRDGIVIETRKPDQTHLRAYSCKAFALTPNAQKGVYNKLKDLPRWNPKLEPRAWIGYLVGYSLSNIYRIWNPITNRVISVRDVVFNEKEIFNRDIQALKNNCLHFQLDELN